LKLTKLLILFLFLSLKGFSQQAVLTSSGDKVILNFLSSLGGTISGTLSITGATTITGTTNIGGLLTTTGGITNTGALTNTGNLTVNGNGTITGTLNVGFSNIISGTQSFAAGLSNRAAGAQSIAMGSNTTANGDRSTAMGRLTTASGNNSAAMGFETTAYSFGETVIGMNNTSYTPSSTSTFSAVDRLFVVGNGASSGSKSDALTILKDGTLTVKGATTINNNATITGTLTLPSLSASTLLGTNGTSQLGTVSLTGDITTNGLVATLSNTGVISGTYGSSTAVPQITVDSKGRITTITTTAITASGGGTISHTIGESYGDGIVFYTWDNGAHGLIVAKNEIGDLGPEDFNPTTGVYFGPNESTGAFRFGIGGGLNNSDVIVGKYGGISAQYFHYANDVTNGYAALFAQQFTSYTSINFSNSAFGDWYLPSMGELLALYSNINSVNGSGYNSLHTYWSSTEVNGWYVYALTTGGGQNWYAKSTLNYVLPIRKF